MHCMIVAYLYLCLIQLLHFADDISVSSDDVSVSSMEECEENESEGLQILSTTLDMVGENVLANQLKQECGKWNNLSLISYSFRSLLMIILTEWI